MNIYFFFYVCGAFSLSLLCFDECVICQKERGEVRSVLTCTVHSCPDMAAKHDGYKKGSGSNAASNWREWLYRKPGLL